MNRLMLLAAIAAVTFSLAPSSQAQSAYYYDNAQVLPGPGYQPQTLNGTPRTTWQPLQVYRYSFPRYQMPRQVYSPPEYMYTPPVQQYYYAPQVYVPQLQMPQLQLPPIRTYTWIPQ
jgi:hypothetical protein